MITFNEGNILEIENEKGILTLEDDIQDGMSFVVHNEPIALKMVALVKNEQLKSFINHEFKSQISDRVHFSMELSLRSKGIGSKEVLQMVISDVDIKDKRKKDYKLMFLSEDTTYVYPLEEEEWNRMISLVRWVSNGYKN